MKNNLLPLNKKSVSKSILKTQHVTTRQSSKSENDLLALNAMFDAAKAGEACRQLAAGINNASAMVNKTVIRQLFAYNNQLKR